MANDKGIMLTYQTERRKKINIVIPFKFSISCFIKAADSEGFTSLSKISCKIFDTYFQLNAKLCKAWNIEHRVSAAYHPQTNGLDERTNQTIKT